MEKKDKVYNLLIENLKNNQYLSTPRNNKLLLEFIKSKFNGGFGRMIFNSRIADKATAIKKARNIKKFEEHFKKDIEKISEEEFIEFRDLMNNKKVFADKTIIVWNKGNSQFKIEKTNKCLSFRTMEDYKINFNEFYQFIREYNYQEQLKEIKDKTKIKEMPDNMRYFKVIRPKDHKRVKVNFIPDDELITLLNNIKNRDFKAFVQQSIQSGARICEARNIRFGREHNLYKEKGKWIIHLPQVKRNSGEKFPFEIDMYEDELVPYYERKTKDLKEGDLVFKYTEATISRLMIHYTTKYIGKKYTGKILRKTARMLRTNAGYSEQWINKLMGHTPGSKVVAAYINQSGIKQEDDANERLKGQQYPGLKKEYENIRLQMKAQQEAMKEMKEQMKNILKSQATKEELRENIRRRKK